MGQIWVIGSVIGMGIITGVVTPDSSLRLWFRLPDANVVDLRFWLAGDQR